MLYAQVTQADGASRCNILLTHRLAQLIPEEQQHAALARTHSSNLEPRSFAFFTEPEIEDALRLMGLPATSSLSVLAVELLPGSIQFESTGAVGRTNAEGSPLGQATRLTPDSANVEPDAATGYLLIREMLPVAARVRPRL